MKSFEQMGRSRGKTILVIVIVSGLIFSVGAFALLVGLGEMIDAGASKNWPSVEGRVIGSKVQVTESSRTSSSGGSIQEFHHEAEIRYQYAPDEKLLLTGDRISFGGVTNQAIAERTVKEYPVNKKVKVYYDPEDPGKSALEPGYSAGMLLLPVLGLVAVGCAVLSAVLIWKFS